MRKDTKRGGNDPANNVSVFQSGLTGAHYGKDTETMHTLEEGPGPGQFRTDYSIVASNAPHPCDPLEEALQRLDAAYDDAVNMAIASYVDAGLITEDEARRIYEQKQVWQEVRV